MNITGAAYLNSGRALLLEATSRGGIEYEPAEVELKGTIKLKTQVQEVDDLKLDKWVTKVRNAALSIVRRHAVHIDIGLWFTTEAAYGKINKELEACIDEVISINARSRMIQSVRETRCEIWPFAWDPHDRRLSLRMGQLIYYRLSSLRDSYTDKRKERYRVEKDRCRNLEQLVVGEQSRLVQAALHSAEEQRPIMVANYGGVNYPIEWGDKVPAFDYRPIDAAISIFAPTKDLFLLQKVD
jgi:hypothetical protein